MEKITCNMHNRYSPEGHEMLACKDPLNTQQNA